MKRRAQITLFIMLGLVLLISILILIFAQRSIKPKPVVGDVEVAETLAKTCLARTTENALAALADDGVVLLDESGPLPPPGTDPYLVVTYNQDPLPNDPKRSSLGSYSFIGLCGADPAHPNGIGRFTDNRFTCFNLIYQYANSDYKGREIPAVQLQLINAIQQQMTECVNASGKADMIIQRDGLIVEWDNPPVQYTPRTPIHRAFKAAQFVVQKEVNTPQFSLNRIENGLYPDRAITCDDCDGITITYDGDSTANGTDTLLINASAELLMRMQTADRGIALTSGAGFIDAFDLATPIEIRCIEYGEINLDDYTVEAAIEKAKTCKIITYGSGNAIYTFDDDNLTIVIEDPQSLIKWTQALTDESKECRYAGIAEVPCHQHGIDKFQKYYEGPIENPTVYRPDINTLKLTRHCEDDLIGIKAVISDGTYEWPAILSIPAMDTLKDTNGNEVRCEIV